MITRQQTIECADHAANAAGLALGDKMGLSKRLKNRADLMAQFVACNRTAPAEALYRFATAGDARAAPWDKVGAPVRVACEVFRASFLALTELMEASAAAADAVRPRKPRPASERIGGRIDGPRARTPLRGPKSRDV